MLVSTKVWSQTDLKLGTTPGIKDASAVLDLSSTTKGLLIPRLTTVQMNAITSPTVGLMIYNTDLNCLHYYFSGWKSQCDAANMSGWSILGNANTTPATNFLGTTNSQDLVFRTNNTERLRILSGGFVGINTSAPTSTLDVSGSVAHAITAISTSTTLNGSYSTILLSGSSNNQTLTLPAASTCARRIYIIVNRSTNDWSISPPFLIIDSNNNTSNMIQNKTSNTLQSDGTNWYQIQ